MRKCEFGPNTPAYRIRFFRGGGTSATQNLRAQNGGLQLGLRYDAIDAMMCDFEQVSFMAFLKDYRGNAPIHLVRATQNSKWSGGLWEELAALSPVSGIVLHEIAAGHWLHVENPAALLRLFAEFEAGST